MDDEDVRAAKRAAGRSAVETVADGDVVGLGSGSTAAEAIAAVGEAVADGLNVVGVPTSFQARELAIEHDVPLAELDEVRVDVAIDGADQIAGSDCIKGGGGAHAREKVVDHSADRFVVVVDPGKVADALDEPVPVEVLPSARRPVADAVEGLGGTPTLRRANAKSGPVVTDNGNLILDAEFGTIEEPERVANDLAAIPGVVAHGLFVGTVDEIHVGRLDGSVDVDEP